MSDWDFLHEMHAEGYSPDEIAAAAGSGAAPWEWASISKEWVDSQFDSPSSVESDTRFKSRSGPPFSTLEQAHIFHDLVDCAIRHFDNTGRYLQMWGELGEMYAEIKFGLCRHETHKAGSDGLIAGKRVEVKTISPEKSGDYVTVKSQGDFEQLLIVRIDQNFEFSGKLFERSELARAGAKFLKRQFKQQSS